MDDLTLVRQILDGDEAAFTALVDREHAMLVRLAKSVVRDHSLVDEIVQDAWLAVVSALPSFEGRSSLRTWIGRITVNRARTVGTKAARCVPVSALGAESEESEDAVERTRFSARGFWDKGPTSWGSASPESLLLRREILETIEKALEDLPPGQRAVLTLRDLEGFSSEEVCNVLELTESNQRVLLHRARARVRAALERRLEGG
jgi:RNA polymerase sigma-70 factor (ECF subfamily)